MKKTFLMICAFLFSIIIIQNGMISASALNTGFSVADMSKEEQEKIEGNLQLAPITSEPTKYPVACFDVREDGMLVIGSNVGIHKQMICVYNQGEFQYGYIFTSAGDFGVEWDGDRINLCFVRGDRVVSVDIDGQILQISKIEDTYANRSYWDDVRANKKSAQGQTYAIQNDFGILNLFAMGYSQLTSTNADGQKTVLYDARTIASAVSLLLTITIPVFVVIVVVGVTKECIKCRREYESRHQ
jgi:hypothetical protein